MNCFKNYIYENSVHIILPAIGHGSIVLGGMRDTELPHLYRGAIVV